MRVIKSPYAENRKVNTDTHANWGLLVDAQAAASSLSTPLPQSFSHPSVLPLGPPPPSGQFLLSVSASSSSSPLTLRCPPAAWPPTLLSSLSVPLS